MPAKVARKYVHLNWADRDHQVVVTPEDEDRFLLTVKAAMGACKAYEDQQRFQKQFRAVLNRLGVWIDEHKNSIRQAYVTVRDAGLLFLIVRGRTEYDRDFEDELTALDVETAQDAELNLIKLSVLALPMTSQSAVESFISSDLSLSYPIAN